MVFTRRPARLCSVQQGDYRPDDRHLAGCAWDLSFSLSDTGLSGGTARLVLPWPDDNGGQSRPQFRQAALRAAAKRVLKSATERSCNDSMNEFPPERRLAILREYDGHRAWHALSDQRLCVRCTR